MHRQYPAPAALNITTPAGTYPVLIAPGGLTDVPTQLASLGLSGVLWLVSDSSVLPLHGEALAAHLRAAGRTVHTYAVPAGEASKSAEQFWALCTWLIEGGIERRDTVLSLGGGVVGDLTGFAAASVLRGVALVHLPTTLLAMVDAALGGKTGINHPRGKNLIGAFHQPRLVLGDTHTLRTLPARELAAGWAEVIKHSVIRDAALFAHLEDHAADLGAAEASLPEPLASATIRRAAAVKVAVVNADEREQGERVHLNYGHTLGHALEATLGYGTLLHGEAVAIGMHAAAAIAVRLGLLAHDDWQRQQRLLAAYRLPTAFPPQATTPHLMQATLYDKKVRAGRVQWVLPTALGAVTTRDDVPADLVRAVLDALLAAPAC